MQIHKYTNTQIYKYTNTQIHKYTNTQIQIQVKLDDVTFASLVQRSRFKPGGKMREGYFCFSYLRFRPRCTHSASASYSRDLAFLRVFSLNSQCGLPDQLFDVQGSRGTRLNLNILATNRATLVSYLNWFSYLLLQSLIITITTAFIIETDTTIPDTSISISVHTWRLNIEALS